MRKITVLIEGSHKTLYLSENVSGITTGSTLTVESATVYWDYNNVIKNVNDTITFNGNTLRFVEGYWTFAMLSKTRDTYVVRDESDVAYAVLGGLYMARSTSGGCTLYTNHALNLGKLAPLIGFGENTAVAIKTQTVWPNPVDINRGLKYITVSCDMVDGTRNISMDGRRSDVIMTIPVPPGADLKCTVTRHYVDTIPSNGIQLQNGCFNSIAFDVSTNIGPTHVGSILLELCISGK